MQLLPYLEKENKMKNKPWETKITEIQENEIRIHGYTIEDLMEKKSFAETAFLLFTGKLPDGNEGKLFKSMMVACADHGVTPPSTLAALTAASTGSPMNGALAAGILSINEFHGGAIENTMKFLIQLKERSMEGDESELRTIADDIVKNYTQQNMRLPGFGHRIHTKDPRTVKLLMLAKELELSGTYVDSLLLVQDVLSSVTGKSIPVNVDGALGALLLDLAVPHEYANAFFIMSRVPGLIAHIFEEQTMQKKMRRIDPVNHIYTGEGPKALL